MCWITLTRSSVSGAICSRSDSFRRRRSIVALFSSLAFGKPDGWWVEMAAPANTTILFAPEFCLCTKRSTNSAMCGAFCAKCSCMKIPWDMQYTILVLWMDSRSCESNSILTLVGRLDTLCSAHTERRENNESSRVPAFAGLRSAQI